ncbi:hypothetical protein, partial [Pseudomonas viridiflava]
AIYMEILHEINSHYKLQGHLTSQIALNHLSMWGTKRQNISGKIRKKLLTILEVTKQQTPASRISDL